MNTTTRRAIPLFRTPVISAPILVPRAPETGTPHTCPTFLPTIRVRSVEARSARAECVEEGPHLGADPGQLHIRHPGGAAVDVGELHRAAHHRAGLHHRE